MTIPDELLALAQIKVGSRFGDLLTRLARQAEIIVELGTFKGVGSTYCLYLGMERPSQRLYSIDLYEENIRSAQQIYNDSRIQFIHGTLVLPSEVPPFNWPQPDWRCYYDSEVSSNESVPYVLDQMPPAIDLLMMDSGEWSGEVEFSKLWERSNIICMDDTNPLKTCKHVKSRTFLLEKGWSVIADNQDERNGWAAFQRP